MTYIERASTYLIGLTLIVIHVFFALLLVETAHAEEATLAVSQKSDTEKQPTAEEKSKGRFQFSWGKDKKVVGFIKDEDPSDKKESQISIKMDGDMAKVAEDISKAVQEATKDSNGDKSHKIFKTSFLKKLAPN